MWFKRDADNLIYNKSHPTVCTKENLLKVNKHNQQ